MKNPYGKLILVLIVSFIFFVFLSTLNNLKLFGLELNQIDFKISATYAPLVDTISTKHSPQKLDLNCKVENTPDTTGKQYKRYLFIGDSMLEGLSKRFGAYANSSNAKLYSVIWYGSSTKKWGGSKRLSKYIQELKPDFILICLGGNELFIRNIKKERLKYVQSIVSEIGNIPYVWIGPPNWKKDTGINSMIKSVVGENRFFYSANLNFERAKDGMHPTRESSIVWMDEIVDWMMVSKICKLQEPVYKLKNPTRTIVLTPYD